MVKSVILFVFIALGSNNLTAQIHYLTDCFKGGVVGDGYNAWYFGGESTVSLPIPMGSSIKKAFFFSNLYKYQNSETIATDKIIEINSIPLTLSEQSSIGNSFFFSTNQLFVSTCVYDITSYIDPLIVNYTINPFADQSPTETPLFSDFYILVLYENMSYSTSCIDVYVNNLNTSPFMSYDLSVSSVIAPASNVGIAVHGSSICDTITDGFEVTVNNTNIGVIGGVEDNTTVSCAGVIGSFSFENGSLLGLGNDLNDLAMSGLDAISNIQSIILEQESFNISFNYISNFSPSSNQINQLLVAYSSSCDTFSVEVTEDTSICQGTSLQLNCSGGQMYEWTPTNNLSCSDCPNPIFTGDSSSFYTVRIWNNDSCSVIRPLKINVLKNPIIESITSQSSECGYNSGSIDLTANNAVIMPLTFLLNDTLSNAIGSFQNLSAGVYSLNIIDGNGCWSRDTTVTVGQQNSTSAFFTTNTNYGASPLNIIIDNSSENATNFVWEINNLDFGNSLNSVTFDTSGIYTLQLVAWQFDPACADTFSMLINVVDSLVIPTLFTPNGDGKNDVWTISSIDQLYPDNQIIIFNRWGSVVFESKKGEYFGNEWNGTYQGNDLPFGTYFYIINTGIIDKVYTGYVSLIR
jgi:gliding motility-associated-like protein